MSFKYRILIIFSILILFIPINCLICFAHPHPVVYIEGKSEEISIHSLHWQRVSLSYLKKNFILEDCDYNVYLQDPFIYLNIETRIFIYHNCSDLKIKKNTLFKDYWQGIPLLIQTKGFIGDDNLEEDRVDYSQENNKSQKSKMEYFSFFILKNIRLPKNPLLLIPILFFIGIFFAISGDFFNLVLPISLISKNEKNKFLWLKSGLVHITSTYIVLFLSINLIAKYLLKYTGFLVIFVGLMILLENFLQKKNISPILIALLPCSGALFVSSIILKEHLILAYFTPLIMGIGETLVLKTGSMIPYPKKYIKYIPFLIIFFGVFLTVKFLR